MAKQIAPETADGWVVLHQFYQIDWPALAALGNDEKSQAVSEITEFLSSREEMKESGQSGAFHLLGHLGDLLLVHFCDSMERAGELELELSRQLIAPFLKQSYSYLSMIELGMYYATVNIRNDLEDEGLEPSSLEWKEEYSKRIEAEREGMKGRRFTSIPEKQYVCFYPMNKKRVPEQNWYELELEKRAMLMMEHGTTGRQFTGRIQQIISGSIGFDDWEWAVDLFSDDPLAIKQLVYEMRFDEGSAVYAEFGPFYYGVRVLAKDIPSYLKGELQRFPKAFAQ